MIAGKVAGTIMHRSQFWPATPDFASATNAGFRLGDKGTHTSRTMMLEELTAAFAATTVDAKRGDYAQAAIDGNCFGKSTVATRRLTNQRLGELYGLDPEIPVFRILRWLWSIDSDGWALLSLLVAMARDPLLLATAHSVIPLRDGAEFLRDPMKASLRQAVGGRLNDAILDKVARNAASSWTQAGHLVGRTFKRRQIVRPTAPTLAFALYLGYTAGFRGNDLLATGWVSALDCSPTTARELALSAKRLGLIDLRIGGDVFEIGLDRLDPWKRRQ
jgi:hypothetical protein